MRRLLALLATLSLMTLSVGCDTEAILDRLLAPSSVGASASCQDACGFYLEEAACGCDDQCMANNDCCTDYESLCGGAPGGSADSCEGACGQYFDDGGCQCDEQCVDNGDCCSDYEAVCAGGPGGSADSCEGACGEYFDDGGCQCDEQCVDNGDCCSDYESVCGGSVEPPPSEYSCEGTCGIYYDDGGCQCDSLCVENGDCCSDFEEVCGEEPAFTGTCDAACGWYFPDADCQCDAQCVENGDCCPGYDAICTGTEPPPEGDPESLPEGMVDYFSLEIVSSLESVGMTVHTGDMPPAISGNYELNSLEIAYDDDPGDLQIDPYLISFSEADTDGGIKVCTSVLGGGDEHCSEAAFISGWGNCFTVFAFNTGVTDADCQTESLALYSGCMAEDGISDFYQGFVMLSHTSGDCSGVVGEGHQRVVTESDGLASAVE